MIRRTAASSTLAALALVFALGAPHSAAAADAATGQDEIMLKDGGTIRGTVVSSQPGVGVKIIELGETQARMIPWAQVSQVERGKFATEGGTVGGVIGTVVPPEPPPPPPGPPIAPRNQVRLHVDSPVPASVFSHQIAYGAVNGYGFVIDAATPVCTGACDRVFDAGSGQLYTVGGDFNSSAPFSLGGRRGDVELSVKPGSRGVRALGASLVVVGGLFTILGASFAIAGAIIPSTNTTDNLDGSTSQTDSGTGWFLPTGLALAGGGVAMLVGGVVALVASKTKTDLHPLGQGGATAVAPRYWMGEF